MLSFMKRIISSPEATGAGKLPVHATLRHYETEKDALQQGGSPYYQLLSGKWNFKFFPVLNDIQEAELDSRVGCSKIDVPGCWDMQGFDHPQYLNIVMPFSELPPQAPAINPVGLYSTGFDIPENWTGRRIILHFDGVENCFVPSINGAVLGFSKDSRGDSEFDISKLVKTGSNELKVLVSKYSDASFIEDQDQWWHAGIVRKVYLYSIPHNYIEDVFAAATLDSSLKNGELKLTLNAHINPLVTTAVESISNGQVELSRNRKPEEGWNFLVNLYDADSNVVLETRYPVAHHHGFVHYFNQNDPSHFYSEEKISIPNVKHWNAEAPYRYTLSVQLIDSQGRTIDATSVKIGFRRVETSHRQLLINGKPVLISGVNRHEHNDSTGRTLTPEQMRQDVLLMKQFNINAVRTSHYPDAPEFYDYCDEYGIYVFDEANIETHAYFYDLAKNPQWAYHFLDRVIHMVMRDKNHPSVIVWSMGNEAGFGPNHLGAVGWQREYDSSRVTLCERMVYIPEGGWLPNVNRYASDIVGPMYPNLEQLESWAKFMTEEERPFIIPEYAHAMGNSCGALAEYYRLFRTMHGLQGGFIWELLDHGIKKKDENGVEYWGYGGDFDDTHNDSSFVIDGLVFPDRTPHPALYELKYLAQPAAFEMVDPYSGRVRIFNRKYFTDMSEFQLDWELLVNGKPVQTGTVVTLDAGPEDFIPDFSRTDAHDIFNQPHKHHCQVVLDYKYPDTLSLGDECHVNVSLRLKKDLPWAKQGHLAAWEQFEVPFRSTLASVPKAGCEVVWTLQDGMLDIDGILTGGQLNILRAAIENDCIRAQFRDERYNWRIANGWIKSGYYDLKKEIVVQELDRCVLAYSTADAKQIIHSTQISVRPDKHIVMTNKFDIAEGITDLPRLGLLFELPSDYEEIEYFGRGPMENHWDRKAAAKVGCFKTTVDKMYVPYIVPQENGTMCDTRSIIIGNGKKTFEFKGSSLFTFRYGRYSREMLENAKHTNELKAGPHNYLYIDYLQRGVGSASCGPDTPNHYKLVTGKFKFILDIAVTE